MTNAKNSNGLDATEMETDFDPTTAATPPVMVSTVSTNLFHVHSCDNEMCQYVKMLMHVLKLMSES